MKDEISYTQASAGEVVRLNNVISEKNQRINELGEEVQRLREANRQLQAEGPALERDKLIAELRKAERHNFDLYTKSNETAMRLGEEVFKLKEKLKTAWEALSRDDDEISGLRKELRKRWEGIEELNEKVIHYEKCDEARIAGLNACLEGKTLNDNPFKENPDDLYFEYWSIGFMDIRNGLEQERRIKDLKEELRKRWNRIEKLGKEKSKLTVLLEEAQSDCKHLVLEVESLGKANQVLEKELWKNRDRIEELDARVRALLEENKQLTIEDEKRTERLDKENQRLGAEINGLESEIETLKHDLAHTQGNYELAEDRLKDCYENYVDLEAINKELSEGLIQAMVERPLKYWKE